MTAAALQGLSYVLVIVGFIAMVLGGLLLVLGTFVPRSSAIRRWLHERVWLPCTKKSADAAVKQIDDLPTEAVGGWRDLLAMHLPGWIPGFLVALGPIIWGGAVSVATLSSGPSSLSGLRWFATYALGISLVFSGALVALVWALILREGNTRLAAALAAEAMLLKAAKAHLARPSEFQHAEDVALQAHHLAGRLRRFAATGPRGLAQPKATSRRKLKFVIDEAEAARDEAVVDLASGLRRARVAARHTIILVGCTDWSPVPSADSALEVRKRRSGSSVVALATYLAVIVLVMSLAVFFFVTQRYDETSRWLGVGLPLVLTATAGVTGFSVGRRTSPTAP